MNKKDKFQNSGTLTPQKNPLITQTTMPQTTNYIPTVVGSFPIGTNIDPLTGNDIKEDIKYDPVSGLPIEMLNSTKYTPKEEFLMERGINDISSYPDVKKNNYDQYDTSVRYGTDYNRERAVNQSGWEQLGNVGKNVIP